MQPLVLFSVGLNLPMQYECATNELCRKRSASTEILCLTVPLTLVIC